MGLTNPEHQTEAPSRAPVRLETWGPHDLPLLQKAMGDPEMTKHLGEPESAEKLAERHVKYERLAASGKGRMFKIIDEASGRGDWHRRLLGSGLEGRTGL
jgi:hypothetical protein